MISFEQTANKERFGRWQKSRSASQSLTVGQIESLPVLSNRGITIKSLSLTLRLDCVRHNVTSTSSASDLHMVVLCTL